MMTISLQYVQRRKNHYRYRRKVPLALRDALGGQVEIVIPLGTTEADVVRRWPKAHKDAEKRLAEAVRAAEGTKGGAAPPAPLTPLERFKRANEHIVGLGLDLTWTPGGEDAEDVAREVIAEGIARKYREDDEGHPQDVSEADRALLRALALGGAQEPPQASLEDARKFYLGEKVEGTADEVKKTQRIDRAVALVRKALGRDPIIAKLTRADAREVRDHMLSDGELKPSTVHRMLNDVRAVINLAIKELPLPGVTNPFLGLEVKQDAPTNKRDERKPFTEDQLKKARARVSGHASEDLQLIWRMLEGTGARLSEVAGLLVSDVFTDHRHPHINLVFHPHRRLKNTGSIRRVPLVGDALKAAQEAVELAQDGFLFPGYAKTRARRDAASAALMKHVRKITDDEKVTVHSLRHNMKDRLRIGGVEAETVDAILGHSSGKVGDRYGGDEARLEVAMRGMLRAFRAA
ncbi:tyrosine-type recombinase/integrase [Sinorhizobium sp. 22678]|uniref:tyrosine-type recombinase/integrase n=1 Tax=Sinorhizobium sp. 22678 TaxID=3453955 RepID=UPI003F87DCE2